MVWSREERSLAAGLVVLALVGAGWRLAGRLAAGGTPPASPAGAAAAGETPAEAAPGAEIAGADAPAAPGAGEPPGAAAAEAPPLIVHVAGAVARPGVYRLPAGARVFEALDAAGGPGDDAAVDAINLAAEVVDGTRLYIPTRAELADLEGSAAAPWTPAPGAGPAAPAGPGNSAPVAVNRATAAELQRLPGIGPVLADRIIAYRREHGPFTTVDDLLGVSGIGPKVLEQIRPYV